LIAHLIYFSGSRKPNKSPEPHGVSARRELANMRKSAELVIWPSYFDVAKSRKAGRKIGRNLAVERPTVEELARAAGMSGIPSKIDKSAAYPSAWWEKSGRLFVSKTMPKGKILTSIAKNLKKLRTKDTK